MSPAASRRLRTALRGAHTRSELHAAQRDAAILRLLAARGFVTFRELEATILASPASLRRDLARLHRQGKLVRVHGGARSAQGPPRSLEGVPFHENVVKHAKAKSAIGRAAAALCEPGEAIIIDGGSTTLTMCPHIENLGLQVLTNALNIVNALLAQTRTRITLPAGTVFREQNIVLSPYEDDGIGGFHASKLFMGAASLGPRGAMQVDTLLIQAERRFMKRADRVILLVDSSKFEAPTGHRLCRLDEIDTVITDDRISPAHARMLESAGVKLLVARRP